MSDFEQEYCFLHYVQAIYGAKEKVKKQLKPFLTVIVKHVNEIHCLKGLENEVVYK